MRPVRLELDGFASFRSATVVDFTDADFFALVGPTGAGKSTVIDAMVFALYGSAPRWDRANTVQYALAPTSTRATVRLVFDIGDQRYQVAREVRRAGKSGPQQKAASLERFDDPSQTTATTDQVTVLASEVRELTGAVEQLIGLSFDDFTKAVVLPQGRFAEFLSTTPAKRQEILLKLLGAHQYELVMKAAGVRRAAADTQVATAEARIEDLGGATAQAEQQAADQLAQLNTLAEEISSLTSRWHHCTEQRVQAETAVDHAQRSLVALAAVQIPDDVTDLAQRAQCARERVEQARTASLAAEQTHARARTALDQAGDPAILRTWHQQWTEQAELNQNLPRWRDQVTEHTELIARASDLAEQADQAWQQALNHCQVAQSQADQAQSQLLDLAGRRDRLAAVLAPAHTADLSERWDLACQAESQAQTALNTAEQAEDQARAELGQAGDPAALAGEAARYRSAIQIEHQLAELSAMAGAEQSQLSAATRAADRAEQRHRQAAEAAQSARDGALAHTLRQGLQVGHSCPVCTAVVATLPVAEPAPDADLAAESARTADHLRRTAEVDLATATARARATADQIDDLQARLTDLVAAGGQPAVLLAQVTEQQERLQAATQAAEQAGQNRQQARAVLVEAQRQVAALQQERQAARSALRTASSDLATLGAPAIDTDSPHQGWQQLTGWAEDELERLDGQVVPAALADHDHAATALERANELLTAAAAERSRASAQLQSHSQAAARAQAELDRADQRIQQLAELLAEAPDLATVAADLAQVAVLQQDERQAFAQLQRAGSDRDVALAQQQQLAEELGSATELLRQTRDPLVELGAPATDESDLPAAWSALATWAQAARGTAQQHLVEAQQVQVASRQAEQLAARAVTERLTQAELSGAAEQADTLVATALARASDRVEQIRRDRERLAGLISVRDQAVAQRDVAALLAQQLNAKNFPRWLAAAALDLLLEAASASLLELSGGQFGLTHEDGEFFVIDHAEADARRSVKTLSGGETFQASLALALALSAELSSLSSTAAKLDSIFLDEGFGSLDPDSLEVVAQTLERLAQGDRMVGVITHVQQLADRIPTRFQVSRTPRGSTVTKVG